VTEALDAEKAALRQAMRAIRAGVSRKEPEASEALVAHCPAAFFGSGVVAGYWPTNTEIDPRPLLAALRVSGVSLALPRMATRVSPVAFLAWNASDTLAPDAFGIPAPPAIHAILHPRIVLAPLLAFDRKGGRLGQGGGHYDRVLARLKPQGVLAVGLAFSEQEVAAVPRNEHDQRLDWVITPSGAINCAG
jgi:5-formyltetrahydrofolate cyclo-ligase